MAGHYTTKSSALASTSDHKLPSPPVQLLLDLRVSLVEVTESQCTQDDVRKHFEQEWAAKKTRHAGGEACAICKLQCHSASSVAPIYCMEVQRTVWKY